MQAGPGCSFGTCAQLSDLARFQHLTQAEYWVFLLCSPLSLVQKGPNDWQGGGVWGWETVLTLAPLLPCGRTGVARESGADRPSFPLPSAATRSTHKLKDEEQVREGGEDREAAGQGAAS